MHVHRLSLGLIFAALLAPAVASAQSLPEGVVLRVVIIRHGEKPDAGDNLSCAGLNRALALPAVLNPLVGTPAFTYVPTVNTGKKTTSARMFQTVTPFAVQKNLVLNTKYSETDTAGAADEVRTKAGIVLMVWEHSNIPGLARNMKVNGNLSWQSTDFDSIWIVDFTGRDSKGKATGATLTVRQENIHPNGNCPN